MTVAGLLYSATVETLSLQEGPLQDGFLIHLPRDPNSRAQANALPQRWAPGQTEDNGYR